MRTRIALPILIIGLLIGSFAAAQVKIGENPQTINPASVLELESTDRVLVITRVDSLQMAAIVPSPGALVYNTSADCVFYYNGTAWINLCNGATTGESGDFTTEAIANVGGEPTIVITPTATGNNFEVAPNSISTDQIANGSIFAEDLNLGALDGAALVPNSITRDKFRENSIGPFAIDRDSLPLSFFNNDAGFITGANIVSGDADNAIVVGGDGGAFYDDSAVGANTAAIAAAIAADGDTDATNEIQDLAFDAATRTISLSGSTETVVLPVGADEVDGDVENELTNLGFDATTNILSLTNGATVAGSSVDLSSLAGGGGATGDDNQNMLQATLDGANILTIPIENGNATTVDLSSLAGGGGGGGGIVDQNAAEVPVTFAATNYNAATQDVEAHLVGINTALASGGGGGDNNQTAAQVPVTATAVNYTATTPDVEAHLAGIDTVLEGIGGEGGSPTLINNTESVTVTGDGSVETPFELTATGGSGISGLIDGITIVGAGTIDDEIRIAPGTPGFYLTSIDVDSPVTWEPLPSGVGETPDGSETIIDVENSTVGVAGSGTDDEPYILLAPPLVVNQSTFIGNGSDTKLNIQEGAIVSAMIEDGAITPDKIEATGEANQILTISADGLFVEWVDLSPPTGADGGDSTDNDNQNLTLNGNSIEIDNGNSIDLTPILGGDGGDNQNLALNGNVLEIDNGDSVDLAPILNSVTYTAGAGLSLSPTNEFFVNTSTLVADWTNLANVPTGFLDGIDADTQYTAGTGITLSPANVISLDATTLAVDWSDVANIPAGFLDGTDADTQYSAGTGITLSAANVFSVDPTTLAASWTNLTNVPTGFLDGTDADTQYTAGAGIALSLENVFSLDATTLAVDWSNITSIPAAFFDGTDEDTQYSAGTGISLSPTNAFSINADETTVEVVTDVLRIKNGGVTNNKLDKGNIPLSGFGIAAADITLGGFKITGSAEPTVDQDLATKKYVDDNAATNLANEDLTQSGGDRTYNLAGQNLAFIGNGSIGIGNTFATINPANKLDVDGSIRARQGFASTEGSANNPGYGFYTNGDTNMGMFRAAADQLAFSTNATEAMRINASQNVGIGIDTPSQRLDVEGNIRASGNFISGNTTLNVPDFVFQKYFLGNSELNKDYNFKSLNEIESFVEKNHHLPGIKSAAEVKKDGSWNLSESNLQNLEKIEELYLHTIEQEKKIIQLQSEKESLSDEVKALRDDIDEIKTMLKKSE